MWVATCRRRRSPSRSRDERTRLRGPPCGAVGGTGPLPLRRTFSGAGRWCSTRVAFLIESFQQPRARHGGQGQMVLACERLQLAELLVGESEVEHSAGTVGPTDARVG